MDTLNYIFGNEALRLIITALGGSVFTIFVFLLQNRRSLLTYIVSHSRLGITAQDPNFGDVRVTHGGEVVTNLFYTNLEVWNRSIKDINNLTLKVYTANGCDFLSGRGYIDGTVEALRLSNEYIQETGPTPENRTPVQIEFVKKQIWYDVPVINREQRIVISFLIDAAPDIQPGVFISCQKEGVKLRQKFLPMPTTHVWGIPMPTAAWTGVIFLLFSVPIISLTIEKIWLATALAAALGALCTVPGAAIIRSYEFLRKHIVG